MRRKDAQLDDLDPATRIDALGTLKKPGQVDDPACVDSLPQDDEVLRSLDELMACARENMSMWLAVMERVERTRQLRATGMRYRDMGALQASTTPTVIEAVTTNQDRLNRAAAAFRRATAQQLLSEGVPQAEIARMFGVTRQRVAAIIDSAQSTGESEPAA